MLFPKSRCGSLETLTKTRTRQDVYSHNFPQRCNGSSSQGTQAWTLKRQKPIKYAALIQGAGECLWVPGQPGIHRRLSPKTVRKAKVELCLFTRMWPSTLGESEVQSRGWSSGIDCCGFRIYTFVGIQPHSSFAYYLWLLTLLKPQRWVSVRHFKMLNIISELQIKSAVRQQYALVKTAKSKKTDHNCWHRHQTFDLPGLPGGIQSLKNCLENWNMPTSLAIMP